MGAPYPPPPVPRHRPIGVTILAVLTILAGIIFLPIGVVIIAFSVVAAAFLSAFIGGLGAIAGAIFLVVGIIVLVAGYGLLHLRMWAWWLAFIAFVLSLLAAAVSVNLIGGLIDFLLIIYPTPARKPFRYPRGPAAGAGPNPHISPVSRPQVRAGPCRPVASR